MTKEEARERAETEVYVYMMRWQIEQECRTRGIKVTKNCSQMEEKFIEAMAKEYMEGSNNE